MEKVQTHTVTVDSGQLSTPMPHIVAFHFPATNITHLVLTDTRPQADQVLENARKDGIDADACIVGPDPRNFSWFQSQVEVMTPAQYEDNGYTSQAELFENGYINKEDDPRVLIYVYPGSLRIFNYLDEGLYYLDLLNYKPLSSSSLIKCEVMLWDYFKSENGIQ